MTGFVAAPPAAAAPVADAIAGDGWWPALSIAVFREATRLGTMVTDLRAREALLGAAITVGDALAAWRAGHEAAGVEELKDVPGRAIGGETRATVLWRRAVYATAAADLAETHNDISATDQGRKTSDARATSAADHRRNAIVAIRDLLGASRARVALL
ncbi:MAG: head completion/stabilization protein [Sphingomonas sp.]|nr:head completion/stabilization protein [Sphingomonas sp.]